MPVVAELAIHAAQTRCGCLCVCHSVGAEAMQPAINLSQNRGFHPSSPLFWPHGGSIACIVFVRERQLI